MKNTIRCCISCILPCGALDVIRIVHSNGRVEEISGTVRAAEIMKAYPKHVLKKPSTSAASEDATVPKIVVVSPEAELQRGKIYFLMPLPPSSSSTPVKKKKNKNTNAVVGGGDTTTTTTTTATTAKDGNNNSSRSKKRRPSSSSSSGNYSDMTANLLISDQYLSEILSEKVSTQRDRRRGRVGVWRPHLESISESPIDASSSL